MTIRIRNRGQFGLDEWMNEELSNERVGKLAANGKQKTTRNIHRSIIRESIGTNIIITHISMLHKITETLKKSQPSKAIYPFCSGRSSKEKKKNVRKLSR